MSRGKLNADDEARIYDHEGRISIVEAGIGSIRRDIKEIKVNHLFHIEKDIRWLKSTAWKFIGAISIVLVIVQFGLAYFVK